MRVQLESKPRGIALIIVMLVIVVFMILAGGFAYSMKVETKLARNSSMDADLEWLGRSGVEMAKWILSQPKMGCGADALNQKWAGGSGDTNLADISLDNNQLGKGSFSIKIVDLDRKFNINTIKPGNTEILRQAMILIGADAAETPKVVNAILDWIDPDNETQIGSSDTESAFYMSLNPPYRAKNGPIDDITELMLINGISPAMFHGTGQGGEHSRALPRHLDLGRSGMEEPTYPIGLVELFTTLSGGQVNINTASATVLQIFPEVDENIANAIVGARAGPSDPPEGVEGRMAFCSVQELARVATSSGVPPQIMQMIVAKYGALLTVRSTTFEVNVEAQIDSYKRHYVAVVRRDGNKLQTLFFYWK